MFCISFINRCCQKLTCIDNISLGLTQSQIIFSFIKITNVQHIIAVWQHVFAHHYIYDSVYTATRSITAHSKRQCETGYQKNQHSIRIPSQKLDLHKEIKNKPLRQ